MKKATITVGVSASGKSTWAENERDTGTGKVRIVERDAIRKEIWHEANPHTPFTWPTWKWKWEDQVTKIQRDRCVQFSLMEGPSHLIISDTNLNKKTRDEMGIFLTHLGFEVEIRPFPVTWEEAVKRDTLRANGVGYPVLAKQFEQWHDYQREVGELPKLDGTSFHKKEAIIVDLDGTLAHMNGRRGPFEWDKVDVDEVDWVVRSLIQTVKDKFGITVLILSGRDSCCRNLTESWLRNRSVPYDYLFMRPEGDMRGDEIVKRELFEKHIMKGFKIQLVVDDRPKVVRMWQSLGLKTLICGNPWKEF